MGAFNALVWNGFREARRNRITVVVAAFAAVVLLSSTLVTDVTVRTFDRVLTDFGLGSMSIILTFLAIFLSCGLLSREIERRTIFMMMSKPVSRSTFLVARLWGNMLTLLVLLAAMVGIFCLEMLLYHVPITGTQMMAAAGLWIELLVLSSAGFLFSTFASQTVSAIATTGLYFAGHLSADIYNLASRSKTGAVQLLGKVVYYVLPDLERLNFRSLATYQITVPGEMFLGSIAYGMAYAVVLCILACIIFSRRDFR